MRDPSGNFNVHIREASSPAAPTLVLIHGVGGTLGHWDRVVNHLPQSLRVVRYDLRGHGESYRPAPPYHLDDFVDDHNRLMADLGIERYHLWGSSLGGLIAQGVALTAPPALQRLVISSAVAGRTPEARERALARYHDLEAKGPEGMSEASAERWFTPEFRAAHPEAVEEKLRTFRANTWDTYLASYYVLATGDLIDRLSEIQNETLIITGEGDIGSPPWMAENMGRSIARSTVVIIPGQKHSLTVEVPDQMAALVAGFVQTGVVAQEVKR